MLISRKSIDSTTGNAADDRIKAEKHEVIAALVKAEKKYTKMLTQLSK